MKILNKLLTGYRLVSTTGHAGAPEMAVGKGTDLVRTRWSVDA